jgi:hypothetical protein
VEHFYRKVEESEEVDDDDDKTMMITFLGCLVEYGAANLPATVFELIVRIMKEGTTSDAVESKAASISLICVKCLRPEISPPHS